MESIGWTTPQSGGSQKLGRNRTTRVKRAECTSTINGITTVFRAAAGERKQAPTTRRGTVHVVTHAERRRQIDAAIMRTINNQNYESGE